MVVRRLPRVFLLLAEPWRQAPRGRWLQLQITKRECSPAPRTLDHRWAVLARLAIPQNHIVGFPIPRDGDTEGIPAPAVQIHGWLDPQGGKRAGRKTGAGRSSPLLPASSEPFSAAPRAMRAMRVSW